MVLNINKIVIYCFFIISQISCVQRNTQNKVTSKGFNDSSGLIHKKDTITMNGASQLEIAKLKSDIMDKGDTNSYKRLRIVMLDYPAENFIFWSMCMANKYNYPPAYLHFYYSILDAYKLKGVNFKEIDRNTQILMKQYLKIAANKGVEGAKEILSELGDQKRK